MSGVGVDNTASSDRFNPGSVMGCEAVRGWTCSAADMRRISEIRDVGIGADSNFEDSNLEHRACGKTMSVVALVSGAVGLAIALC
jgi:predicted metal-binding protein